jgi:hypothetical protein
MTLTGVLTDYEGDVARINDQPKKMLPAASKWCHDRLKKGMVIDYDLVDDGEKKGWIAKLWERKVVPTDGERLRSAGFNTPNEPPPKKESPDMPALKTVEGQIIVLDVPAHKVVLKTKDGQQHGFTWPPALNDQMAKLKQWFFVKLTGEHEKEFDIWRLTAQEYFKRPDDWPAPAHKGGGFQPRNDKAIILQTCLKVAADVLIARGFCEDNDPPFEEQMDRITAAAIKAAGELCKVGGVQ